MRIVYLNGHPVWTYGLPWGFRKLGHDIRIVDVIRKADLTYIMENFQPDLLVSVGWIAEYVPKKLAIIREAAEHFGCLHAYWATEDVNHLIKWSLPMVRAVQPDVVFTINAECIPSYLNLGIPAFHLDFGYNPAFPPATTEQLDSRYSHDLALVANYYDSSPDIEFREKSMDILVRPLVERGYDLALWGNRWERAPWLVATPMAKGLCQGPISFEDSFKVYKNSKIILNLQNENHFSTQVTSRTFEILGSDGFQLTARTPAIEGLFIHSHHLVMSSSPAETLGLVDYYLAHEEERLVIAAHGQAEVLAKHTYDQRAAYMLSCLDQDLVKERKKTQAPAFPHRLNQSWVRRPGVRSLTWTPDP